MLYAEDVARYLNLKTATLIAWVRKGLIPMRKESGKWCIEESALEEWLDSQHNACRIKTPSAPTP